jgi:hypothetical protein
VRATLRAIRTLLKSLTVRRILPALGQRKKREVAEKLEMKQQARQLLRQIRDLQRVAMAYYCRCGQRIMLTNFEPSALQRRTEKVGIAVMERDEHAICPKCGAPLASVWQTSERAMIEAMLAKLESLNVDDLVQVLQVELRALQEARLKCN